MTCAALVFASQLPVPAVAKAVLLALALASADLALGACWAVPIDIAPDHAGVITGCMNTLGNLGGLVGPLVVGVAVDRWQSWSFPFYITALVYAGGALAWLAIDPLSPIQVTAAGLGPSPNRTIAPSAERGV
jgi:nitrate/nitrite transporter NarK